jgi:hypothetical protein
VSARPEVPAEWASEKQNRQARREEGAVKVSELFSSMLEVVENAAESFSDKLLKAQPAHRVDEAKHGEQEG